MNLAPGTRLGPYEVLSPLGAGGMGEVYRARDTRLGRDVAVKVLPQHLSEDAEVRARFEREAKTVSALNHPNICTLFDVGREGDTDFLVMELVEGETLAHRLKKGALPVEEVLRIGSEVADALDRAHRAGVVHRDLKPGNIMLTRTSAKLMDFGLARVTEVAPRSGVPIDGLTQSPAAAQPLTAEGTIVGTFQYMAPEQLEGKEAGVSVDIWAFGCVLYEMATGRRAFAGNSQASLIGSIMGSQPEAISRQTPMSPPALDRLVSACLAKDPADRLQSAHDIKLQLAWVAEGGSLAGVPKLVARKRRSRERLAWAVSALAVLSAAVVAFIVTRAKPAAPPVYAFLQPPQGVLFSSSIERPLPLAISPDGSTIAFCARGGEGPDELWVRSLGAEDAHPLAGTEGAEGPFFSPDGRSLAFYAGGKLLRVDVAGGPVIELADNVHPRGGSWNRDGVILFTNAAFAPIFSVPAGGGSVTAVTVLDTTNGETTHRYPHFLPDGRHFLFLSRRAGAGAGRRPTIFAGELGSLERTPVVEVASNVVYASGYLVYVRGSVLVAQHFDLASLKVDGPTVPLVDDVRMDERFSRGTFAVSNNGVLVCMTGNNHTRTQLRWLSRTGERLGDVGEAADYTYGGTPNISPDGKLAVLAIANSDRGTSDVWLVELESGRRRKLTVDTADHPYGMWLPGGRSVAVTTAEGDKGGIDAVAVDGTSTRRIVSGSAFNWPHSAWGDRLLYTPEGHFANDILSVSTSEANAEPQPLVDSPADERGAQFSPDGRFVAYASNETGRQEIFVVTFPPSGGRWQVSQSGGSQARWRRDGRELFYFDPENNLVAVEVEKGASGFQMGAAHKLFQFHTNGGDWRYDVSPDGQRFLVATPLEKDLASPVTVITDWTRIVQSR